MADEPVFLDSEISEGSVVTVRGYEFRAALVMPWSVNGKHKIVLWQTHPHGRKIGDSGWRQIKTVPTGDALVWASAHGWVTVLTISSFQGSDLMARDGFHAYMLSGALAVLL